MKVNSLSLPKSVYLLDKIPNDLLKEVGVAFMKEGGNKWDIKVSPDFTREEVAMSLLVLSKEFLDK